MRFIDVARKPSQNRWQGKNSVAAKDPNQTKLMIMVYWGGDHRLGGRSQHSVSFKSSTQATPEEGKLIFNFWRDRSDFKNAKLLGYDSEEMIGTDYGRGLLTTAARLKAQDLLDEIGDNRYFVVLMAYDFQLMWKEKKHKLLWETRFSIRENRNDFGVALPAMAQYASRYFAATVTQHVLIRVASGKTSTSAKCKVIEVEPEKKDGETVPKDR